MEAIRASALEPPVVLSDTERTRSSAPSLHAIKPSPALDAIPSDWTMWRITAEILATRVFRCLSANTLEPAMAGRIRGMLDRCESSAAEVGDTPQRMEISTTLEIARSSIVSIARQLIEGGCTTEESRGLIEVAERERARIRGPVVMEEMEHAVVQPIIVE